MPPLLFRPRLPPDEGIDPLVTDAILDAIDPLVVGIIGLEPIDPVVVGIGFDAANPLKAVGGVVGIAPNPPYILLRRPPAIPAAI